MRLIDADELEKVMTEDWFLEILAAQDGKSSIKKDIENMIDSVPLAYDVEKVVEELESEAERWHDSGKEYNDKKELGVAGGFRYAIPIVRKGGVDNE